MMRRIGKKKLEELVKAAAIKDGYLSRYHEDVISGLCKGSPQDINEINQIIDDGYVSGNT